MTYRNDEKCPTGIAKVHNKTVINKYKQGPSWQTRHPIGIGDFIRGCCFLISKSHELGFDVEVDLSSTDFAEVIQSFNNPLLRQRHQDQSTCDSEELLNFEIDNLDSVLHARLSDFIDSNSSEWLVTTNAGWWGADKLSPAVKEKIRDLYRFSPAVVNYVRTINLPSAYNILAVRTGDEFKTSSHDYINTTTRVAQLEKAIKKSLRIQPHNPTVLMIDSESLRERLSNSFNFITLPHKAHHGCNNGGFYVAADLHVIKQASAISQINLFGQWWSGFTHYTALIHDIPILHMRREYSKNFRLVTEAVVPGTGLVISPAERARRRLTRLKSNTKSLINKFGIS